MRKNEHSTRPGPVNSPRSTSRRPEPRQVTRRELLGLAAAAGVGGLLWPSASAQAQPRQVDPRDRKLLFVFCAQGGASIIDSFLPIVDSEVGDAELASTLNAYPESLVTQPSGSNIRYVARKAI